MPERATEVSLSTAAHRLGLSWSQTWRLVLRRELDGRKAGARWVVDVNSIERLAQSVERPYMRVSEDGTEG